MAESKIKKVTDQVDPFLSKLVERTHKALDSEEDLTSKDHLAHLVQLLKLKANLTGEFIDNKNISFGPNEVYKRIMGIDSTPDIGKIDPKLLEPPKWIE